MDHAYNSVDGNLTIFINKGDYETIGSHSLLGKVVQNCHLPDLKIVTIKFMVKSNYVSESVSMKDYVPMMLIEDILAFKDHGIDVRVMSVESRYKNHYEWLSVHLPVIFTKANISWENNIGIIRSHGNKAYGYKNGWESNGIHFFHGVALYLLSYYTPYSKTCRELPNRGWCDPGQWVINHYGELKHILPPVE